MFKFRLEGNGQGRYRDSPKQKKGLEVLSFRISTSIEKLELEHQFHLFDLFMCLYGCCHVCNGFGGQKKVVEDPELKLCSSACWE